MGQVLQSLQENSFLLKQKASRHSITGTLIAIVAVIIGTVLSGYFATGEVGLDAFIEAQKNNIALWFLNAMPFIFAFWGQYVSSILSFEASSMILDQTHDLRTHTKILEKKAAHEATHDSLTDLPNRSLFIDRLQQAANSARRDGTLLGVLLLDIDRFKEVNDTLGHYSAIVGTGSLSRLHFDCPGQSKRLTLG
jgi:predicted signal transduction protein with EAL and GGDEF domain